MDRKHVGVQLSAEQHGKFRVLLNGALTKLLPDAEAGEELKLTDDERRLVAGALGTEGTAREVEAYVEFECAKWSHEPLRKLFLEQLLATIKQEIELLEFYVEDDETPEFPLPTKVKVLNAETGISAKPMPTETLLAQLRSISASSVFKN